MGLRHRCWATWARTWLRSSPRRRQPARGRPHAQSRHGPSAPAPEPQQALDRAGPEDARRPRGLPSAGRGLRRPALQHPPQAMARLGLSYEAVAARNPRIVYLGAYGFGEQGPYAGRPAYDDLIQGQAGIAALYARQSGEVPRYAPDAGGSRRRPACRHRAGVGRAACPSQRTRAAGRDSHVRGHGAHDAGRPPGRRHARPAAGPRRLRQAARATAGPTPRRRLPVPADLNDKHWRNFSP